MIKKSDMIIVSISRIEKDIANFLAERRVLFEFPRPGYGDYDTRSLNNIQKGILGELAFLDIVYRHLNVKYHDVPAIERYKILRQKFCYRLILGVFDDGFEFVINGKKIDIKTYANQTLNFDEIYDRPYNLFIDRSQDVHDDHLYVQTFILSDNRVCIAGYYDGLPSLATWMPQPAYTCPVPELSPINDLIKEL